jgi:hypothetical protein
MLLDSVMRIQVLVPVLLVALIAFLFLTIGFRKKSRPLQTIGYVLLVLALAIFMLPIYFELTTRKPG